MTGMRGDALRAAGMARLRLVDVAGRVVRKLLDGELPGGAQRVSWSGLEHGRVVPAGVYFAELEWRGSTLR